MRARRSAAPAGGRRDLEGARALRAPAGLTGFRLEVEGEELVVLEWSVDPTATFGGLTSAETEVVALAAAGSSNAEIGRRRGTSSRTVANQLASAFAKLGVRSRLELFARLSGRRPGSS